MNGNRPMEMYYGYPNPYNNNNHNHNHQQQQQHQHQQVVNESSYIGMGMGMGLGMNMSMSMGMGMDFFDGYHQQPPLVPPPPNYIYPHHHLPIPMHSQESAAYWSMNMNNNSYRSNYPDSNIGIGSTPSYYGYQINDALPRTEINRRTWEYSSSMHIEEPTIDHMHHQHQPSPEHVVVSTSDAAQDCPLEGSDTASPEAAWQDDIDPDNMTYEELLDLGEAVGTQSRGLSNELIKLLPTSRFKAGGFFSRKKSKERCVICLVTYKIGDQQMTLPCKHVYHSKCGRKWLSINKTCPVCNSEVFGDEGRN